MVPKLYNKMAQCEFSTQRSILFHTQCSVANGFGVQDLFHGPHSASRTPVDS